MIDNAVKKYVPALTSLYSQILPQLTPNKLDIEEKEESEYFENLRIHEIEHREAVAKAQREADEREKKRREDELQFLLSSASAASGFSSRSAKRRGIIITESARRDDVVRQQKEAEVRKADEKKASTSSSAAAGAEAKKKAEEEAARVRAREEERLADSMFDILVPDSYLRSKPVLGLDDAEAEKTKKEDKKEDISMSDSTSTTATTTTTDAATTYAMEFLMRVLLARVALNHDRADIACTVLQDTLSWQSSIDTRILDPFTAPTIMLLAVAMERSQGTLTTLRSYLLNAYPSAVRTQNSNGALAIAVCVVRSYILERQYMKADTFIGSIALHSIASTSTSTSIGSKTGTASTSSDSDSTISMISAIANSTQFYPSLVSRLAFYMALIDAILLRYADAKEHVIIAIRASPDVTRAANISSFLDKEKAKQKENKRKLELAAASASASTTSTSTTMSDATDASSSASKTTPTPYDTLLDEYTNEENILRGVGFYQTSIKLYILCQLLVGDIPERHILTASCLQTQSMNYFIQLITAVRRGDLKLYHNILNNEEFMKGCHQQGFYGLLTRVESSVQKTALSSLTKAYSKMKIENVQQRLGFQTQAEAELFCSKAIADGLIDSILEQDTNGSIVLINYKPKSLYDQTSRGQLLDRLEVNVQLQITAAQSLQHLDLSSTSEFESHQKSKALLMKTLQSAKTALDGKDNKKEDDNKKDDKSNSKDSKKKK